MKESIDDAQKGYEHEVNEKSKILNEMGYAMNPETGKLERKESL
jgi:hypothetical protein